MNAYLPHLMRIADAHEETHDVRTLRLEFLEPEAGERLRWRPGQFGQYSVFGTGECVFTIANPPTRPGHIECTFRGVGKVTSALRRLSPGQLVGFRGPYGNSFPLDDWRGNDIAFVGGGIGMAALHAPLREVLDRRDQYGELLILNGARSVADIVYRDEMREWESIRGVRVVRTVDPGGETPEWDGEVGLIPSVFEKLAPSASNCVVVICGPPVMLHFMLIAVEKLGFAPERVLTTLENRMKCGVGQCGRCNVGPFYVCRDGPVVTAADLKRLPAEL